MSAHLYLELILHLAVLRLTNGVCLKKSEPILRRILIDRLRFAPAERSGAAEFPPHPPSAAPSLLAFRRKKMATNEFYNKNGAMRMFSPPRVTSGHCRHSIHERTSEFLPSAFPRVD